VFRSQVIKITATKRALPFGVTGRDGVQVAIGHNDVMTGRDDSQQAPIPNGQAVNEAPS
jgi:hypothetical protein